MSLKSLYNRMRKVVAFLFLPYLGNVSVLEARQMREENPGDVQQNENIQLQLTKKVQFQLQMFKFNAQYCKAALSIYFIA